MLEHGLEVKNSTNGRAKLIHFVVSWLSRLAPAAAAWGAERFFITPPATSRPPRESAWAATARQETVPSEVGDLATWTWGDSGPTVLLVHGWAGRGLQLGAFAQALAAGGWRVVAFDAPGHGSSAGRTSSMVEISRAAVAVAQACGGVDSVIAHSLGATAVVFALGQGELEIRRLAALAPSANLAEILVRFAQMTGFTPEVVQRMEERVTRRFDFDWKAAEPLEIAPRMEMPLLVVHDRKDRFVPFAEGEALAAAWPDAELLEVENLGHHRLLRDPRVVDRVVASFDFASAPAGIDFEHCLSA